MTSATSAAGTTYPFQRTWVRPLFLMRFVFCVVFCLSFWFFFFSLFYCLYFNYIFWLCLSHLNTFLFLTDLHDPSTQCVVNSKYARPITFGYWTIYLFLAILLNIANGSGNQHQGLLIMNCKTNVQTRTVVTWILRNRLITKTYRIPRLIKFDQSMMFELLMFDASIN